MVEPYPEVVGSVSFLEGLEGGQTAFLDEGCRHFCPELLQELLRQMENENGR